MYGAKVRDFPKILCGAMLFFHIVDKPAAAAQENPAPFAAVMTDYGYETADGTAKSRVTTLQSRVTYGTAMTAENTVTNYNSAYEYDANGNITAEYAVQADNTRTLRYRYTYDEANQLTRVDDNVRGKTYVYTYDKGGNRVSEKIYNYTLSNTLGTVQQEIQSQYGYLTWKDRLSSYNGNTITYDAAGNPIKYGNTTYAWSGKQLIEIQPGDGTKTQFSYDADGLRTQKRQYNTEGKLDYYVDYVWQNGKLTQQVMTLMGYNADGSTVKIRPINTKFVYDGNSDQPTACFLGETQMLFVRNLQGDIIAVVNADGEVLVSFTYDAWGNVESTVSEGQEEGLATLIPLFCPLTYRGYNYDFTTGLYYLQSRYYNPEWGRFMNVDDTSILLATQGDTHNANLFAYCNNNPVNNVDYTGYECEELISNILIYVIFPLALVYQKFVELDLAYVLDKSDANFSLIYDQYGILTYRFQLIFYSYSQGYLYYRETFDFDLYYANYNAWNYFLENYNKQQPAAWLMKQGVKQGAKAAFGYLGVPAVIASIATKITFGPITRYVKRNDQFVKQSKKYLKKFKKTHADYEDTMFYAFSSINWITANYATGETHVYNQYKGDKRIEALI